jgi:hypothetical protein
MKEKSFTIKALVRDKRTKECKFIESVYDYENDGVTCLTNAIKMMRKDISGNGYSLITNHIKEKSVFDFIVNETNCEPLVWKYINKVFPSYEDAKKFISAKIWKK